jgi:hypothetical protein
MRLRILLPKVTPEAIEVLTQCAYAGCGGRKFHLRQAGAKPLRDTVYQEVQAHRYQCLKCKRTFRVYPRSDRSSADLATGERASRDVVSARTLLWSGLLSLRRAGDLTV